MADAEELRGAQLSMSLPVEDRQAGMEQHSVKDGVIYPDLVYCCLRQISKLRQWCLDDMDRFRLLNRISVMVIILSCLIQGSYKPCVKDSPIREVFEAFGLLYFLLEMLMKMVALSHPTSYLACNWHKLDVMLFIGELSDLLLGPFGVNLKFFTALRPIRLISRVPSMKVLVSTVVTNYSMLFHVVITFLFMVHVFGVVAVSLWAGGLQNRCFLGEDIVTGYNLSMSPYYVSAPGERTPFLCSQGSLAGSRHCSDIPPHQEKGIVCTLAAPHLTRPGNWGTPVTAEPSDGNCVDWNQLYSVCRPDGPNPNRGSTNFDNIGYAWITVYQIITLIGWSDIMHEVMDTHSFWSFVPFVVMTTLGSFVLMNILAVVIVSRFSEAMDPECTETEQFFNFKHYYKKFRECLGACFKRWLLNKFRRSMMGILSVSRQDWLQNLPAEAQSQERNSGHHSAFWVTDLVISSHFNFLIGVTVSLNIIILAIEHHGQSQGVTAALQVCNYIVVSVYTLEMILKLLAFKTVYFQDHHNLFDFVIVIISLWEVGSRTRKKLTIVRTCRAIRLAKVLHFMTTLKKQLVVLLHSMNKAATLCCLMLFFIFMFSVMGMHMFGCKFTWPSQTGEVIQDRQNFDSLLWSMVTVFQIITQDSWNLVLYNAMASISPWSGMYFVTIILLGRCIFLSVVVGIVIQNFQTQQTEEHDTDEPNIPDHRPSLLSLGENTLDLIRSWYEKVKGWSCIKIPPQNTFHRLCKQATESSYFKHFASIFIVLSSITVTMERPSIGPNSMERKILDVAFYLFPLVFCVEIFMKVVASDVVFGEHSYFRNTWHWLDSLVVSSSMVHVFITAVAPEEARALKILKAFRLLRVFNIFGLIKQDSTLTRILRALVVSLKPMANTVLLCWIFFFFYGILGVQLFKGKFYHCIGEDLIDIVSRTDCLAANYRWELKVFNFDSILQALLSLFVMFSMDGWVNIMHDGLDAVAVDQQPIRDYNLWVLPYFISFMVISFFLLDMFTGVMVESFHKCQASRQEGLHATNQRCQNERQGAEEEPTDGESTEFSSQISRIRAFLRKLCATEAMEALVLFSIILNVLLMSVTHYNQPECLSKFTESLNCILAIIVFIEVLVKLVAFGVVDFAKDRWNLLDLTIVFVLVISITVNQINTNAAIPFNPTILRVCRLLRPSKVLNGKSTRLVQETIINTLSQVWGICPLFLFLFATYAALGVELFGKLECSPEYPCLGLHRHSNFSNFLMALLTLYRVFTGDNWTGILKDTMRKCRPGATNCLPHLVWVSPIYYASFVMVAQFLLLNLVVAIIMQALEDSKKKLEVQQQSRHEPPSTEEHRADNFGESPTHSV